MNPYLSTRFMPLLLLLMLVCAALVYVVRSNQATASGYSPDTAPDIQSSPADDDDTFDPAPAISPAKNFNDEYAEAEFVNKYCTSVKEMVIDERFSIYDLRKLLELNGMTLCVGHGWVPLIIDCVKELEAAGWTRRITVFKEKFGELRFGAEGDANGITSRYCDLSKRTCETCGAPGEIRYRGGWMFAACRKHYFIDRGIVQSNAEGFVHNELFVPWAEIASMKMEDSTDQQSLQWVTINPSKKIKKKIHRYPHDFILISAPYLGFGNFMLHIPEPFKSNYAEIIARYHAPTYCGICGYQAVFSNRCECCEYAVVDLWAKKEETDPEDELSMLKFRQMDWRRDNGDEEAANLSLYPKNPDFVFSYTEEEYQEFLLEMEESDEW